MLILTILLFYRLCGGASPFCPPASNTAQTRLRRWLRRGGRHGAVWLWAVCIWSRRAAVDFDGFRLAAVLAMQGLSCGIVCGFPSARRAAAKLRTPAAVVLLLAASRRAEVFIGNLSWLATSRYTPVDLRPYLTNDPNPLHR